MDRQVWLARGVIRNFSGACIKGFATKEGMGDIFLAETVAVLRGLNLC